MVTYHILFLFFFFKTVLGSKHSGKVLKQFMGNFLRNHPNSKHKIAALFALVMYKKCLLMFFEPYPHLFSPSGLMFVPKDASLRGLVVAERAVATKCEKMRLNV